METRDCFVEFGLLGSRYADLGTVLESSFCDAEAYAGRATQNQHTCIVQLGCVFEGCGGHAVGKAEVCAVDSVYMRYTIWASLALRVRRLKSEILGERVPSKAGHVSPALMSPSRMHGFTANSMPNESGLVRCLRRSSSKDD